MMCIVHEKRAKESGMFMEVAALHPGGSPRVTDGCTIMEVVV